jgi:transposase-like protein
MRVKRRPRGKRVLHCPKCDSTRIVAETGGIFGQMYHCQDCDYIGAFVIETDAEPSPSPTG